MEKILAKIKQWVSENEEKKQLLRVLQVVLLAMCTMGFVTALLIDAWMSFVVAFFQLCLIGISFCFDKGVIKTDKMYVELIAGVIAVVLIVPYCIGLLSIDNSNTLGEKNTNIDWSKIVLAEVLPEPTSISGYIKEDSEYEFTATLNDVLPEEYDAYIIKCRDSGFTLDIEKGDLKYKAFNADGYRLELSYLKSSKQLGVSLLAPESMENLVWEELRISKVLPQPKSVYGNLVEVDEQTVITLGKMTKDDLQDYIKSCKEKGFDIDVTEKTNSYEAKNKDGYLLICEYKGGNTVSISISEPLYDIKLELACKSNLLFSKYDVEVFVDDERLGCIDHGATKTFDLKLKAGKYELKICERDNSSVDGTYTFLVTKDQTKKYKILCSSNQIGIEKNEASSNAKTTNVKSTTTTTTENILNDTLEKTFPEEMAKRAVVVAMTNGSATDVFNSDGNTYDISKFHSYADTAEFYLSIDESGVWNAKDDKTWHVDNMILDLQGQYSGTSIRVSADVTYDGYNYVLSGVKKIQANSKYINSNDPYKVNIEELEPGKSTPYLTVSSELVKEDRENSSSSSDDFEETRIIAAAKRTFENYGEICYPYGFECHWTFERIAMEVYSDGTCYIKVGVTITNQYGIEVNTIAEGKVKNNVVSDFYVG